jgi:hypothetical protein
MSEETARKNSIPDEKRCCYCTSMIHRSASVCPQCGRDQRWYLNYFRIDHIGLIIALAMIVIAYWQLQEVRQERIAANQALEKAHQAEKAASSVADNLGLVRKTVEEQQKAIGIIAERAKQAFSEIQNAQQLSSKAKSEVETARALINKAEIAVDQLRSTVDFNLILIKARNDDREAFDQLVRLAEKKGPFQVISSNAAVQIAFEVNPMVTVRIDPQMPWKEYSLDPKKDSLKKLLAAYPSIYPIFKPSYISEIWSQDRFTKQSRLDFLYEIIKSDKSLHALDRACVLMNQEAKINKNIFGAELYLQWWQANKSKYTENK